MVYASNCLIYAGAKNRLSESDEHHVDATCRALNEHLGNSLSFRLSIILWLFATDFFSLFVMLNAYINL